MTDRQKISREKEIRGKLLIKGLTIPMFAEMHGFNAGTVYKVLSRHFSHKSSKPVGKETLRILQALESYLN